MAAHIKTDHKTCEPCELTFATSIIHWKHLQNSHTEQDFSWKCKLCEIKLSRKRSYTQHKVRVHESAGKKCPECKKIVKNEYNMVSHRKNLNSGLTEKNNKQMPELEVWVGLV